MTPDDVARIEGAINGLGGKVDDLAGEVSKLTQWKEDKDLVCERRFDDCSGNFKTLRDSVMALKIEDAKQGTAKSLVVAIVTALVVAVPTIITLVMTMRGIGG